MFDGLNVWPENGRQLSFVSLVWATAVAASPLGMLLWARVSVSVVSLLALGSSVSLILARRARADSRIERARLLYLAVGATASILFTGLDFLSRIDIPFPLIGPIVSTFYLFFLSQTLLRLRLMDLHELLGKTAAHAVLAATLA